MVTTPGGVLVETVVRVVSATSGTGGGVTSFLVVVAAISAVDVSVVVLAGSDVAEVKANFEVTGRRGASVILVEVTTGTTVSEVTSVVVVVVGV